MRRFEYDDGTSRKFWEIAREGPTVIVRFGRLGTAGKVQMKDCGSAEAAEAHASKMAASKVKKGYVARGESAMDPELARSVAEGAISVERGLRTYMSENSGACHLVVRHADDVDTATEALRRFRDDLWTADLFASLDGEFGDDIDGSPLRYTPGFAAEVAVGPDGPGFWFDAQDILEGSPELVDDLIQQVKRRLREAGVQRAQIGRPREPYAARVYTGETEWFYTTGSRLAPLDERWRPPNFPADLASPAKARAVSGCEGHDGSWTHIAWRRRSAQDEFSDVIARWRARGCVVEPMTAPPEGPPDIAWGWSILHSACTVRRNDIDGWLWTVFSRFERASDLHFLWFGVAQPGTKTPVGWVRPPGETAAAAHGGETRPAAAPT